MRVGLRAGSFAYRGRVRKRARALVVAVALIAAAACGGGGGNSSPPGTIDQKTKDQLAVDAAVLQQSDLPGTWNTNRPASTASDVLPTRDDLLTIAEVCAPTPDGITATTAREYLSGPTLGHILVRGVVEAHSDPSKLASTLATFTPPTVKACLPQLVHTVFGDTAALGDVTTQSSTVEGIGDDRGGFLTSIHLTGAGTDFVISADVVFARLDRFRATCTVVTFDSQPDHALCTEGLKAMVRRLSQ